MISELEHWSQWIGFNPFEHRYPYWWRATWTCQLRDYTVKESLVALHMTLANIELMACMYMYIIVQSSSLKMHTLTLIP
jgi:hypothetical protein